jgi:hypothetical protein
VALVIGVFLAGDVIHPLGYLATVLILSGVALLQYGGRRASVSKGWVVRAATNVSTDAMPGERSEDDLRRPVAR